MNMNNEFRPNSVSKGPWSSLKVDLGASSHPGHVRDNNEDSYLVMRFGRSLENVLTNLEEDLLERNYAMRGYGMLVADGMGGEAGGEDAAPAGDLGECDRGGAGEQAADDGEGERGAGSARLEPKRACHMESDGA